MKDYQDEDWVSLYRSAVVELEQAKMSGRIKAAQKSIVSRVEKLRTLPGLHTEEYRAIDEASGTLAVLEAEDASFDVESERRAIAETLQKLRSIALTVERLNKKRE